MKMTSKLNKGLFDRLSSIELIYDDNTQITFHVIINYDFDINIEDVSCVEFTSIEVSKFLFNRIKRNSNKNTVKKIVIQGVLYDMESAHNGQVNEESVELILTGEMAVKNCRMRSIGQDSIGEATYRLEGRID